MYSINFLEHRQKKLTKVERQDRRILKISGIVFGCLCVVAGALLGVRIYLQQRVKALDARQEDLKNQVISQEKTEEAFLFFVSKLDILQKLFQQRADKQAAIDYFSQVFGQSVLIENISYDASKSTIQFGLKATDVFILDAVFSTLASDQTTKRFSKVEKSDLRRSKDGTYSLQVVVTFPKATS